jgi:hypothetical protein
MSNEPFFTRDGERFVPTQSARGPWDPKSLHGRVIVGLLGAEIERRHGEPDLIPARLTVDMYRLPDLSPVEVTTRVVRDGYRIKVIDAEDYEVMKDGAIISNSGHFNVEIDIPALEAMAV